MFLPSYLSACSASFALYTLSSLSTVPMMIDVHDIHRYPSLSPEMHSQHNPDDNMAAPVPDVGEARIPAREVVPSSYEYF